MLELSTDKKIRKGQFRTLAKEAMTNSHWSPSDPIAKVVSLLEKTYAAGLASSEIEEGPASPSDPIPWEAIPARAREILRCAILYRERWPEIERGSLVLLLDGARRAIPRGEYDTRHGFPQGLRTRMGLWEVRDDTINLVEMLPMDWAASSASALVRLGIFEEYGTDDETSASLTPLGLITLREAIENERIAF